MEFPPESLAQVRASGLQRRKQMDFGRTGKTVGESGRTGPFGNRPPWPRRIVRTVRVRRTQGNLAARRPPTVMTSPNRVTTSRRK